MTDDPKKTDAPIEGSVHDVSVRDGNETIQVRPEPISDIANSKGVLATATDHTGGTIAGRPVQETDVVTVNGVQMSADQAVTHGFLTKDQTGKFVDVSDEEARKALDGGKAADEERRRAEKEIFFQEHAIEVAAATETTINDLTALAEASRIPPVGVVTELMRSPGTLPTALTDAILRKGGDPAATHAKINEAMSDIKTGIEDVVMKKAGLPRESLVEFWSWVGGSKPLDDKRAALSTLFHGDTRGYVELARQYRDMMGIRLNEAKDLETFEVTHDGHTRTMVKTKTAGPVEINAARKMGLI
jgi:hypothetical protein